MMGELVSNGRLTVFQDLIVIHFSTFMAPFFGSKSATASRIVVAFVKL